MSQHWEPQQGCLSAGKVRCEGRGCRARVWDCRRATGVLAGTQDTGTLRPIGPCVDLMQQLLQMLLKQMWMRPICPLKFKICWLSRM